MPAHRSSTPPTLHRVIALLGVLWVLAVGVLAVRPDLHEAVCHHHSDDAAQAPSDNRADDADGCIVTQFADGQILGASAPLPALATELRLLAVLPFRESVAFAVDHALPPGCGPPLG